MRQRFPRGLAIAVAAVVVIGIAIACAVLWGIGPSPSASDRPPCNELPSRAEAQRALDGHHGLVEKLEDVGDGVSVAISSPCKEDPDAAVVEITYTSRSQSSDIENVLNRAEGFGVPVVTRQK